MKDYETSRDYKRLKRLLDHRHHVIVSKLQLYEECWIARKIVMRDLVAYCMGYMTIVGKVSMKAFCEQMTKDNVEFIEPTDL